MPFPSIPEVALIGPRDREISLYDHARDSPHDLSSFEHPYGKTRIRFQDMDLDAAIELCRRMTFSPGADFLSVGGRTIFEDRDGDGNLQIGADAFIAWPLDGRVGKVSVTLTNLDAKTVLTVEKNCLTITPK